MAGDLTFSPEATAQALRNEGKAESILLYLHFRGIEVPAWAVETITTCNNPEQLRTWLRRSVDAAALEDVLQGAHEKL